MSVTRDIVATYRGPRKVVRRLLSFGKREDLALMFVLFGAIVLFIANAPFQAREAFIDNQAPVQPRLYWSAMIIIFLMPFALYLLALAAWLLSKVARRRITSYGVRLTLFWAVLASSPLALLAGLLAGFAGPSPGLSLVLALWAGCFLWFWISGMIEAEAQIV